MLRRVVLVPGRLPAHAGVEVPEFDTVDRGLLVGEGLLVYWDSSEYDF